MINQQHSIQESEIQANTLLQEVYLSKEQQIHQYYQQKKPEEAFELGFASVGFPDDESDPEIIFKMMQPGFIFEVIVINKCSKKKQLDVILQRFLAFCDKCNSSQVKHKSADFSLFKKYKNTLHSLTDVNTMRLRGHIPEYEVIEDFSIFTYYLNYEKIQVGDHLNAVLINPTTMMFSLRNKIIINGKQWSLQNLEQPSTFDNLLFFRLGYSKYIGLNFLQQNMDNDEKERNQFEIQQNLKFKEETGTLKMDYQIKQDMFFPNKQNYPQMLESLGINQVASLTSGSNLKSYAQLNLDHRRHFPNCQPLPRCQIMSENKIKLVNESIKQNQQQIIYIYIMAKQGWGFSNNQVKLDITNKKEKKINIWEKAGEANDIQFIPDAEEEQQPQNQVSDAGVVMGQKLQNINELQNLVKISQLPVDDKDIDFSILTQVMRPFEEVCETDESWEFSKLKTEMQEIVSKLYAYKANN